MGSGLALPGDIAGRAVIDAGSHHLDPQRRMTANQRPRPSRNMSLIVVHAHKGIVVSRFQGKNAVSGGTGASTFQPRARAAFDCRQNDAFLFSLTEQSMFTGVRIQTAHNQLGFATTQIAAAA